MIDVRELTRHYGERIAVDRISFRVAQGEIVGFLGPNGAGKSTTMRMVTGSMMPTSGAVEVAGHDMSLQSIEGRRRIGYMPEIVPVYTDMTVREYLEYVALLRGVKRRSLAHRVEYVVVLCRLEEYLDTIIAKLSKGYRQRVGLAQAVIHDPEVVVLDEPTVGIDPIQVSQTRSLIRELGRDRTVLLSTHILPEVSMTCERVIIIHRGRIVAEDRIDRLSSLLRGGNRLRLHVDGPPGAVAEALGRITGVDDVSVDSGHHLVGFAREVEPYREITEMLVRNGWTLRAMVPVELSLEEIFLGLTTSEGNA